MLVVQYRFDDSAMKWAVEEVTLFSKVDSSTILDSYSSQASIPAFTCCTGPLCVPTLVAIILHSVLLVVIPIVRLAKQLVLLFRLIRGLAEDADA